MTEDELKQIDTILTILSAHQRDVVKAALKRRNAHMRGERIAAGWKIYTGAGEPPGDRDRMRIGSLWYTRERRPAPERPLPAAGGGAKDAAGSSTNPKSEIRSPKSKTDLSMKPTDKRCPLCSEVMAWEPICPGCALGKMGFRGRYVCMDDFDHTFYVTKPGVELPNR